MTVHKSLIYRRSVKDEIMDRPDVEAAAHVQALEGLRRINRVSRAAHQIVRPIIQMAQRHGLERLSLLDVACGGGDVPIAVARQAQAAGVAIRLTLFDRSPTALEKATKAAFEAGIECAGVQGDALGELPEGDFDVVTNSLFLHHIYKSGQVIKLLQEMRDRAARMVVISDLRRSRRGYMAAWIGCRLLSRSPIVHHDGPVSVRAAWTIEELKDFAARAGLTHGRIVRCRPWRMLLTWEK